MTQGTDKLSFKIPETHESFVVGWDGTEPDPNKRYKTFTYPQVETEEEAFEFLRDKETNVVDIVRDIQKANARSNAYQNATVVYKPVTVAPELIRARMIKDFIRQGASEDFAVKTVDAALAAMSQLK